MDIGKLTTTFTRRQRLLFWLRCQRWYPERDKVARTVAWWLPRRVVYWAFIRISTWGYNENPGEQKCMDVLKRNGSWGGA